MHNSLMADDLQPTSAPAKTSASYRRHQRNIAKDIATQQRAVGGIIPYTSFSRLVHEIVSESGDYCVRADAVRALQEATEGRITDMFFDANRLANYTGRETVCTTDLHFVVPHDEWTCPAPTAIGDSTGCPPSEPDL